jgi:hypothetical protein
MRFVRGNWVIVAALIAALGVGLSLTGPVAANNHNGHTSAPFKGVKVNGGTVTHTKEGRISVLTLSDDFKVPDTPDPHWQLVDSKGNTYLVQRLDIKDNKVNRSIKVPGFVQDVAKVQIWCAWAETLLGETSFEKPVK